MSAAIAFYLITIFLASLVRALSFLQAIETLPQLSNFTNLYIDNPGLASLLTPGSTILVPNNDAFTTYKSFYGHPITALSSADLQTLISYHVMVGEVNSSNFTNPKGLIVPTLLTGQTYNNRTPGSALEDGFGNDAGGQVVYIFPAVSSNATLVQSGLGANVTIRVINGTWDNGLFQEVTEFLTLPQNCQDTIDEIGLTSFATAINRTDLWDELDNSPNWTCLSPTNQAFTSSGNPQVTLNDSSLHDTMELHTIPQPLYTNYLQDGQEFQNDENQTIRIKIVNGEIFFNDAMVLQPNIITNNGVIHVLDRVMSELQENNTNTSTPSTKSAAGAHSVISRRYIVVLWTLSCLLPYFI